MTATLTFNPFALMIDVFNDLYPDKQATVWFATGLRQERNAWGQTGFPDDGGEPLVQIDVDCPIAGAVEVLAHELAHVAAGCPHSDDDDGHGPEWQKHFDAIHEAYNQRVLDAHDAGAQVAYTGGGAG